MVATATAHLCHWKSRIVSLEELGSIPAPEGTSTWRPVQHRDVVDAIHGAANAKGLSIASEEYAISRNDRQMFGVVNLADKENPEWAKCIGVRNGNDRLLALGIAVGVQVYVCDNLCLGGEQVFHRRHTARFSIGEVVDSAFSGIESRFDSFESRLNALKGEQVSRDIAAGVITKVAELGGIRAIDILPILREFGNPRHEEFKEETRWSLLNAFTEVSKSYSLARRMKFQRVLAEAFSLG